MTTPLLVNTEYHDSPWTLSHSALASSNYLQVTYNSVGQVTSIVTWTDGTMAHKLREVDFTYNLDGTVATISKKQYDSNLYTLLQAMTGVVAYSSGNVTSIIWVRT